MLIQFMEQFVSNYPIIVYDKKINIAMKIMPFMHCAFCRQSLMFVLKINKVIIQNSFGNNGVCLCVSWHLKDISHSFWSVYGYGQWGAGKMNAENASLCTVNLRPPKKIMTVTEMFGILCRVSILRRRM